MTVRSIGSSEGAGQAYFVTADDDRVCSQCDEAQANSPYPVDDCPVPGLHPNCRCLVTVQDPEPFKALAGFLA